MRRRPRKSNRREFVVQIWFPVGVILRVCLSFAISEANGLGTFSGGSVTPVLISKYASKLHGEPNITGETQWKVRHLNRID